MKTSVRICGTKITARHQQRKHWYSATYLQCRDLAKKLEALLQQSLLFARHTHQLWDHQRRVLSLGATTNKNSKPPLITRICAWIRTGAIWSSFSHIWSVTRGLNDLAIALAVNVSSSACCRMVANGGRDACMRMNNLHYYVWSCLRLLSAGIVLGVVSIFLIHFRDYLYCILPKTKIFYKKKRNSLLKCISICSRNRKH